MVYVDQQQQHEFTLLTLNYLPGEDVLLPVVTWRTGMANTEKGQTVMKKTQTGQVGVAKTEKGQTVMAKTQTG